MNEIMRAANDRGLPFYLENPLRSKLWIHPLIRKWVQHTNTTTVIFDYCQFGEPWNKPTQILAANNRKFNCSLSRRCKMTWDDKGNSTCSRAGLPHEKLKGFTDTPGEKRQYKTAKACPYPSELCELWAPVLAKPNMRARPPAQRLQQSTAHPENPGGVTDIAAEVKDSLGG